jgi:EAL domain-containing protein (putative c-di-GMP-specific phosphodiesterase class I)
MSMFEQWSLWITQFQPAVFSGMLVLLCCALLVLWNDVRQQKQMLSRLYGHSQKLVNELAQQRYALASLRQAITKPDDSTSEQDLLNEALHHLDALLKNMPETDLSKVDALQDINQLKDRDILAFVRKALKDDQVALAVQPIKSLPHHYTRFYEVFARIKLGNHYLPAGKFLAIAKHNGLLSTVDQSLLLKTLELIKNQTDGDYTISYFCNLAADSFSNKKLMKAMIDYLAAHPRLSSRLVFELTQEDTFNLDSQTRYLFEKLSELGCRFSMDNVKMIGLDVGRLHELRLSFVKVNATAALAELDSAGGKRRWMQMKGLLEAQGTEVIIEKIENGKQLDKLKDANADYVQGYYLGEPEIAIS